MLTTIGTAAARAQGSAPASEPTYPLPLPGELPPSANDPGPPRLIDPFPRIRFRGYLTRRGARLTYLRVKAPRGVRIVATCKGPSCPKRRVAHETRLTRLTVYERRLRAGTRLVIKATREGWIGKYTKIRIRRGSDPLRRDGCLYPGETKARACPAA